MTALVVLAAATAVVAAARSTWSPCGLSMLSTITPLREHARSGRYGSTVAWFVTGAVVGGACLGGLMAGLAAGVAALDLPVEAALAIAGGLAAVGFASDLRIGGFRLPAHTRQVDDRWLDDYRRWVYGAGFGWQIGNGLTTFIVTSAVYLTVALGALTAEPLVAFALGTGFGLVRGLAILVGRRATTTEALMALHRAIDRWSSPSRLATAGVQAAVAAVTLALVTPLAGPAVAVAGVAALALTVRRQQAGVPVPT